MSALHSAQDDLVMDDGLQNNRSRSVSSTEAGEGEEHGGLESRTRSEPQSEPTIEIHTQEASVVTTEIDESETENNEQSQGHPLELEVNEDNQQQQQEEEEEEEEGHEQDGKERRQWERNVFKAAVEGNRDAIQSLIANDRGNQRRLPLSPENQSILHIHVAAPFDERPAKVDFIEYLLGLELEESLLSLQDNEHETALHKAATFGQHHAVRTFLDGDLPPNLVHTNKEGDTAMHMALRNNHLQVVQLLSRRSNLDEYSTNNAGESIIFLAADSGSLPLLNEVLGMRRQDHGHGPEPNEMALHTAVLERNLGMVQRLCQVFPDLVMIEDGKKNTPLHYAAGIHNPDILQELLKQPKSLDAAKIQDEEGRSVAHLAVQHNNLAALKLLINHVPYSCLTADKQGRNVVHYAAFLGFGELLVYLLTETSFSLLFNNKDKEGNTPLHLLVQSFKDVPVDSLIRVQYDLFPKLKQLQHKVVNGEGHTPGDIAHRYKIDELEPASWKLVEKFKTLTTQHGSIQKILLQTLEDQKNNTNEEKKETDKKMKKMVKTHSIVTTLIMTVSFTAGVSVPGGFNQNVQDKYGGTAMLTKRGEFQVFLVSDSIALISSLISLLIYFLISFLKGKRILKSLFVGAFTATSIALVALMVAFMFGTCSIVRQSPSLVFLIVLISSVFIVSYVLFVMASLAFLKARSSLMGRDPKRFKGRILHQQA